MHTDCTAKLVSITLLLLFCLGYSTQSQRCDNIPNFLLLDDENTDAMLSVSCLGNGTANVSYRLSDSQCFPSETYVAIQVDYVCSGNNASTCKNTTIFGLNKKCSNDDIVPILDDCNCTFVACIEYKGKGNGENKDKSQMLASSGQSCPNGDLPKMVPTLSSPSTTDISHTMDAVMSTVLGTSSTHTATSMSTMDEVPTVTPIPQNTMDSMDWIIVTVVVFAVVMVILAIVIIITAIKYRPIKKRGENDNVQFKTTWQVMYIQRDATTESLKTILESVSLSAVAEVSAVEVALQGVGHSDFPKSEPIPEVHTGLCLSEDGDSPTYIHLHEIPTFLDGRATKCDGHCPNCPHNTDNDQLSHTEWTWDNDKHSEAEEPILQQTHAHCKEPSNDYTINLATAFDDQPPSSPSFNGYGYGSDQERMESVPSDGYITMDTETESSPSTDTSNWPSTRTQDSRPSTESTITYYQTRPELSGSVVPENRSPVLTVAT